MELNREELERIVFNVFIRIGNDIVFYTHEEIKASIKEILTEWWDD